MKDKHGVRVYDPDSIKEHTALYFKDLYKAKPKNHHPHHSYVLAKMEEYRINRDYENLIFNKTPTKQEIADIIRKKKNGKSTPDIKNEMLKLTGKSMIEFLYPLIKTIWDEEEIPSVWNRGIITCIWKGKGDKEDLSNHRGITTSSAIGTILESMIDNRIEHIVKMTPAQGGGKKGSSCYDHLFVLRAIIDISIKEKRSTYITYYDVSKAYDTVDNSDLLVTMWEKGLRGKSWRILKNLNTNLTASVKTRFGQTREIKMEIGGKQGSRLTGRMFAKMMDLISEELDETDLGFRITEDFLIAVLLWVDDVISCTEGKINQEQILNKLNEFSVKHKLKWGQAKCKVMKVGKHEGNTEDWKLGEMTIEETDKYKYLGDVVTPDGKNKENLQNRMIKSQATSVNINTIASSETLLGIETMVILELHDKICIPGLLNNCESWNLTKKEELELEKIEMKAIKYLFDLPIHTPTAAILFTFGLLYTKQRIDQIQLMYLQKILKRNNGDWAKTTLSTLQEKNIGWYVNIVNILQKYNLPTDFDTIAAFPLARWKNTVKMVIEEKNKERLKKDLYKHENGIEIPKTKTKSIIDKIMEPGYTREPEKEILRLTKNETKTLIIARYGMLVCGNNFKGTMQPTCSDCNVIDNESHRLNDCKKWVGYNFHGTSETADFDTIYSSEIDTIRSIMANICFVFVE